MRVLAGCISPFSIVRSSAHRSCERHHLHSPGAAPTQRGGSCGGGRATCVDVVDQAHARRRRAGRGESTCDISTPLLQSEPALPLDRTCPPNERLDRQVPQPAELVRESFRRPVPSVERAIGVCRNEGERRNLRPGKGLDDESGSLTREPSPATLLPGLHDPPGTGVVDDGGAGGRERQPSPAALRAALDRPGSGCPAAAAEGWRKPDQSVATTQSRAQAPAAHTKHSGWAAGRRAARFDATCRSVTKA